MFTTSFLPAFLLVVAVVANPIVTVYDSPISLSFSRKYHLNPGQTIYDHDYARAQALKLSGAKDPAKRQISTPAQNQAVTYLASVAVGNPPTIYNLIIDTGSSNTWVGASKPYRPTSGSRDTAGTVTVTYGSGSFSGKEFIDTVSLGKGLSIKQQSIGVASEATGFNGVDGILGIGPVNLTIGTVSNAARVPTVTDNLFAQKNIKSNIIAVSFEPETSNPQINGAIAWGGVDNTKFVGNITFVPITSTSPSSRFWGIDQSITYGSGTPILPAGSGIVDTGTTLLLIATDAFNRYVKATRSRFDTTTGLLQISPPNFSKLKPLRFRIGGTDFIFTANAQIWPRFLNPVIGGKPGNIYLIVADLGLSSGSGLDFVNGQSWLERFYSVYDTANSRVGIATTPFTNATTN